MRPPEFTGGNLSDASIITSIMAGFNEAAGIHRRKLGLRFKKVKLPSRLQ